MTRAPAIPTRVLLVCAAIGVATGILGGIEGWLVVPVLAGAPIIYGFILGVHVLPGVIAQELLRRPWVALLAHLLAALVSCAVAPPYTPQFLGTALLFGGLQEGIAALFRYRTWSWWRFLISGVVIGAFIALVVAVAADIAALPLWAQISYIVLSLLGPVAWTLVGLAVGAGLRRAGVAAPRRHPSRTR
ncbi:ECF transporter S component [Microbacterium betulae]|uniref:ECF transporter S component n=1 Tax=Microbacterium betulae TaxID=2981139 RepID=A0AA97I624_9MICO|nr:ECF transporter S component [Microbacterium sp. AB]WOF22677.1 ECF transporter S component [Microbacterium sp. AB]